MHYIYVFSCYIIMCSFYRLQPRILTRRLGNQALFSNYDCCFEGHWRLQFCYLYARKSVTAIYSATCTRHFPKILDRYYCGNYQEKTQEKTHICHNSHALCMKTIHHFLRCIACVDIVGQSRTLRVQGLATPCMHDTSTIVK